jgi:alcohol dehydrogenase class IV
VLPSFLLVQHLKGIPILPEQFGFEQAKFFSLLSEMAEQAINSGSPNNNPRVPSKNEIIEIYKALLD